MEKIRYRLVHNRCKRAAEGEYALVQIEAYLGGRKIYMKTNVYVKPEQWDKQRKEVVNHPLANDLNAFLFDKMICLQQVELAIWKRGVQPTLSMIKEAAAKNRIPATNFIQFAKQSIEMSAKRPGTKENLMSTVKILSEEHPHLQFDELTFGFVREFEARLKQRGLAVNTVAKHLRQLRTMVNEAISSDYIEQDAYPFRRFRIKHEKAEHTHLTYDELEKLERTEPKGEARKRVLRAFLFCVYTGLRFSDFVRLGKEHIVEIDGNRWIELRTHKTGERVVIPIYLLFGGKAGDIIDEHGVKKLTRIGCNAETNKILHLLTTEAGISKLVTMHSARHTFATLLLHDGVPVTTVQKLLGHTSVKTTQIYAEVTTETIKKDLLKCMKSGQMRDVG